MAKPLCGRITPDQSFPVVPLRPLIVKLAFVPAFLFGCSGPIDSGVEQSFETRTEKDNNTYLSVAYGPTLIPRGNAVGAADITVSNDFFMISFGAETASPWGVASGGILDIAIMRDGKPGTDIASLVDFMPNYWSAWPTSYQRVEIEKKTPQQVVVRTRRDWGEVELETRFIIRADSR
ncbi:MAG: hypothetical protein HKN85_01300, partial [Gammaproteobacteria bacterium]|nr:hypothetical protein [Gammaproteobacteria bacterium]